MIWLFFAAAIFDIIIAAFSFRDFIEEENWGFKLLSLFFCIIMLLGSYYFLKEFSQEIATERQTSIEFSTDKEA